jgi:hypothetical protein
MITNLWALLGVTAVLVVVVGIISFLTSMPKSWEKKISSFFENHYVTGLIGITVAIIIGVAISIPIFDLWGYNDVCESKNWTGNFQTNDREWIFGDKITVLCIDDVNKTSNITDAVKVVRKSQSCSKDYCNIIGLA